VIAKLKASSLFPPLTALVLWGFWAFLPKLAMRQSMEPHSVIFYEALGGLCVTVPLLFSIRGKLVRNKKSIGLVCCASGFSITGVLCYYSALNIGPVATVSTITAMYPVVGVALARIFLKEKMNRLQLVAAGMAMMAIYLLAG
jgi:drug/metabolite transporter (DMT)-like permease